MNENLSIRIALITGSVDPHYQLDLLTGLVGKLDRIDFIGGDTMEAAKAYKEQGVRYLNYRGNQNASATIHHKIHRIVSYYYKLFKYAYTTDAELFHIQWPNKFVYLDRTVLNLYYKWMGKKIVITAHNVNAGQRDGNDSFLNRLTLSIMYSIADHIIVHTEKMKKQLIKDFHIDSKNITVIPHGINNVVPKTELTSRDARTKLRVRRDAKIVLFFGNILKYKGLEYLIEALGILRQENQDITLLIAGRNELAPDYWKGIQEQINTAGLHDNIITVTRFIRDEEIEIYFKAADVMALPYTHIFQSGVLFVSYAFGLPVIATDVGSLKEDIIEGITGYLCKPENAKDLAVKIRNYFDSELYRDLNNNRRWIENWSKNKYSWNEIGNKTVDVYNKTMRN